MGLNPSPLYTPVPRNLPGIPVETSRFLTARDSQQKLWKYASAGNDLAKRLANQNSAIVTQMNNQRRLGVTNGAHPFEIYQLPPIYRGAVSSTDWLKVRVRQGGILMKPRNVPPSLIGSAVPGGLPTNNEGAGAWTPTTNIAEWGGNLDTATQIAWANPLAGSGGGIPILGLYQTPFTGPPFTTEDEIYLINGGDPEYQMPSAPSVGWFWLQLDNTVVSGEPLIVPTIHFGGFTTGTISGFGDTPPWVSISDGILTPFNLPAVPNICGSYFVIGEVNNSNGHLWINQHVFTHWIDFPSNCLNWCGQYSTSFIYWTGDVVYDPGSGSGPSGLYMQMLGYNPIGPDGFNAGGIAANQQAFGVSGYGPSDDGDNQAVWVPLGTGYTVA